MPAYEYLVVTFDREVLDAYLCDGMSFHASSATAATDHFRQQLLANGGERLGEHRRRDRERYAIDETAVRDWEERRDALRGEYQVRDVEESFGKGRFAKVHQVTFPDGTVERYPPGDSHKRIEEAIIKRIGAPPQAPGGFADLSDQQLVDRILASMKHPPVESWSVTAHPPNPLVDGDPRPESLPRTSADVLSRLGSLGWRLADVSEDRAIGSTDASTMTTVVGARYTLMRDAPT